MTRSNEPHPAEIFDSVADKYQQARPEYPAELFDTLLETAGIDADSAVLEIGCATGKATLPLARRGLHITGVEIGAELAAAARRNLAAFPDVRIVHSAFESWRSSGPGRFDLVLAATAWHWLDPATRYHLAWNQLRSGGHLAFWSAQHVFPIGGDPFFTDIQDVYDALGEGIDVGERQRRPGELPESVAEIVTTGLFENVMVRHFDWEVTYTAEQYLRLLDTFPVTSPWPQLTGTGCIPRSDADSPTARTRDCADTGEQCCMSPNESTPRGDALGHRELRRLEFVHAALGPAGEVLRPGPVRWINARASWQSSWP